MSTYRNVGLFLVLSAVWGASFVAIKAGIGSPAHPAPFFDSPVLFAAVRYDVAGVAMLAYAAYATDRWRPKTRGEWLVAGVGAALMIAGYHAFLFVGERYTTSAVAAVVVSLSPLVTTGFSRLFLPSERLSPLGVAGLLLGLAGVVVLADPSTAAFLDDARGEALVLGAVLCFALGSVLAQRSDDDLPIETMEAWSMLGGAALLHAVSVGLGEPQAVAWTPRAVLALAYLSLAASALGFLVYFDLLDRLGAIEINMVGYVSPVFAALTGWVLLAETIDPATVVGFLVIFAGFCLLKREALAGEAAKLRATVERRTAD